jgi:hypothetical protein
MFFIHTLHQARFFSSFVFFFQAAFSDSSSLRYFIDILHIPSMYINDFNTVAGAVDLQEDNNVRHEHFANFHLSLL